MRVRLRDFFGDRIQINSLLIVLCFASVLLLESQSAASYPSYLLALSVMLTVGQWNDVRSVPFFWCIASVIGYLLFTCFWSQPSIWRETVGMLARGVLVASFVVAMAECHSRGYVQQWLGRALAVVGALAAAGALLAYLVDPPRHGRLAGLGQLDNAVVAGLVFGAVLILLLDMMIVDRSRRWVWIAGLGSIIVMADIWLSGSRSAWFSTAIGVFVLLAAWRIDDRDRFLTMMIMLSVIVASFVVALLSSGWGVEFLLPRGDSFRVDIWSVVLSDVFDGHALFGKGILTPDQVSVGQKVFQHPHNMYIAILFQGGAVGLILFFALIAWTVRELLAGYGERAAKLGLGLLAMALSSYLLDGHELIDKVGETWFLFWLPVSIGLALAWSRTLRGVYGEIEND